MSTPLSNSPGNNSFNSEPVYQEWNQTPGTLRFSHFTTGNFNPDPQTVHLKFKDFYREEYAHFSAFKYSVTVNYNARSPNAWLNMSSTDLVLSGASADIVSNGISGTIIFNLGNTNLLLPRRDYLCWLEFKIFGKTLTGAWHEIEVFTMTINLEVFGGQSVFYEPEIVYINHYQDTPSPVARIQMTGYNWRVIAPPHYILSSDDDEVTITQRTEGFFMIYEASGYGYRAINLSLSEFFDTTLAIGSASLFRTLRVYSNSTLVSQIPVAVTLFNAGLFEVSPTSISFNGVKGVTEPLEQFVNAYCASPYEIEAPNWLEITQNVQIGGQEGFKIVPLPTYSMEGGDYSSIVTLRATINGIPSRIFIPVTYTLLDYIDVPYKLNDFNFTLEDSMIHVHTLNDNTYFTFLLKGTFFEFYSDSSKDFVIPLKIPLLKKMQKFNIGEGIHRLMRRFEDLNSSETNQYRLARVGFEIQEKVFGSDEIIREIVTDIGYEFIAGFKPKMIDRHAFLVVNPEPTRVFSNSEQFLNILKPGPTATLIILKNDNEVSTRFLNSDQNIYCEKISFADFEAKPGDSLEVRLLVGEDYLSKKFIVFPDGIEKKSIIWEDDFLLKSSLDFSGKYEIKSETEFKTQKLFKNLTEFLVNVESKKTSKLTINTGFLMNSDILSVDNIMSSKKVFLKCNDQLIEIVPIGKNLVENDSDREVVSFDLEFQINRKYNEKIYTF